MGNVKGYALITGASSGIGKAMAWQLAQQGYSLLLTARSADALKQLSAEIIERHHVEVAYFPADLSLPETPEAIANWCAGKTSALSILINNAGYGLWGDFEGADLARQENMLQLNVAAVLALTHRLLPLLKKQTQAYILNISSTAAYQPVPTLAVYAATKSFVLSFSRALRHELKPTGVSVSCLCPGPTATGFADRAGMSALADLAEKFNMDANEVARVGLKGMFSKKAEIIPGGLNKLSAWGATHLPKALIERITANLYKNK